MGGPSGTCVPFWGELVKVVDYKGDKVLDTGVQVCYNVFMIKNKTYMLAPEGTKWCPKCQQFIPKSSFYPRSGRSGLRPYCVNCEKQDVTKHRKANPQYFKDYDLHRRFKITHKQKGEMLVAQGGVCAICGTKEPGGKHQKWHVDHDHKCCESSRMTCGKCIRALLCNKCNNALGCVNDDIETLGKMIDYLKKYQKPSSESELPTEPSKPISTKAVELINSILTARVPEENFLRDEVVA